MAGGSLSQLQQDTKDYIVFGNFDTMDTQFAREALPDQRLAWCENLQIVGPNQLVACNGPAPPINTIPGVNILSQYYANITGGTSTDYIICFAQDGSAYQVSAITGSVVKFATAGTFSTAPDMTTWASQRILMADPTAGYCTWDGTNFIQQGGVSPNFTITNGGSGYTSAPAVHISAPGTAAGHATIASGAVTAVVIDFGGYGYGSAPVISFQATGGGGSGATATAVLTGGVVTSVTITAGGTGYTTAPLVFFASTGAPTQALATATITNGVVTQIVLAPGGGGANYKATDVPTINFTGGGGTGAVATVNVWPILGFQVTTLAVYAGRVWLAGARNLFWTGTKGYDDANPADASGSTIISDADLAHQITALRSLNNFLYIFGDAAIKQIGTITVSASSTIFNIVTLSSDQGTSFPRAIASYNRLILFANKVGVYAVLGASVEKVSDQMDGIFSSLDFSMPLQAAVQDLHTSLHTFLLLCRYKDQIQGITRSLILCFYKNRWFVANQGNNINCICSAPIGGIVETFSSSGIDITQLFQSTTPVPIIVRTSLSMSGKPHIGKAGLRCAIALFSPVNTTLNCTADSENLNPGIAFTYNTNIPIQWINNSIIPVQWVNNAFQPIQWMSFGFLYQREQIQARGVFLGVTINGSVPGGTGGGGTPGISQGFVLNTILIEYQDQTVFASKMSA